MTPNLVLARFVEELKDTIPGNLYLPADWGAKVPYHLWNDPYVKNDKAVVHWYGGPVAPAYEPYSVAKSMWQVREMESLHTRPPRNWRGGAYGDAYDQMANVFVVRGFNLYGAHRGDYEGDGIAENAEGMPHLWLGGSGQKPTDEAFEALEAIILAAERTERTTYDIVIGHKEIEGGTSCPGPDNMGWVTTNRTSKEFEMSLWQDADIKIRKALKRHGKMIRGNRRRISMLDARLDALEPPMPIPMDDAR